MREHKKGYSIIELLCVVLIMALLIVLVAAVILKEINKARGSTLINEARMTFICAQTVMIEAKAALINADDEDYMLGFNGIVDDVAVPEQTWLSNRFRKLLSEDIALGNKPDVNTARINFTVENGAITVMTYEKAVGTRVYTVTVTGGDAEITHD